MGQRLLLKIETVGNEKRETLVKESLGITRRVSGLNRDIGGGRRRRFVFIISPFY